MFNDISENDARFLSDVWAAGLSTECDDDLVFASHGMGIGVEEGVDDLVFESLDTIIGTDSEPETSEFTEIIDGISLANGITRALAGLDAQTRGMFVDSFFDEDSGLRDSEPLSIEEIADRWSVGKGVARDRLARAFKKLSNSSELTEYSGADVRLLGVLDVDLIDPSDEERSAIIASAKHNLEMRAHKANVSELSRLRDEHYRAKYGHGAPRDDRDPAVYALQLRINDLSNEVNNFGSSSGTFMILSSYPAEARIGSIRKAKPAEALDSVEENTGDSGRSVREWIGRLFRK